MRSGSLDLLFLPLERSRTNMPTSMHVTWRTESRAKWTYVGGRHVGLDFYDLLIEEARHMLRKVTRTSGTERPTSTA